LPSSREPETIGRFHLLQVLGQGAQGKVYLAEDPKLQRRVAIKTLLLESDADREKEIRILLEEARMVSRLQHPNIVTLFDAGEENGTPYLVFEYVEGTTLAKLIRDQGRLPAERAAEITVQVLEGIGYAHQMDVIHRDLKPGNIMIDRKGTARVMDFGVASRVSASREGGDALFGTPLYMAPEYISGRVSTPQADLFAAGMILYEMLAGKTAVHGGNVYEILHRMVHTPFELPSRLGAETDERLDEIIMRALEKNPAARYPNAEDMAAALRDYLAPARPIALSGDAKQVALDFLLLKMRHKSDFPALARTVSVVNKIIRADQQSAANLANTILKDFALTNKLLKMVNTAYYQQFGGNVSTVSRAVTILGFDTIRNIALSLMLFDKLHNQAQATHLKDEVVASFFAGILARRLVPLLGVREMEEAFICAMLHGLGRLLVMFYFPEEYPEIEQHVQGGEDEEKAAAAVLGLGFEEIGVGIARAWNFPDKIVYSLRRDTLAAASPPGGEGDEKLRRLAWLANELCRVVRSTPPEERDRHLEPLLNAAGRYATLSREQLIQVVESAVTDLVREAAVLNFDLPQSPFFLRVSAWSEVGGKTLREFAASTQEIAAPETMTGEETLAVVQEGPDSLAILSAGIQDITNTLVSDYRINDVLHIILETLYRALGFSRILLCAVDPQRQTMCGRFGLGRDADRLATEFRFPLAPSPDVFHQALQADYLMAPDIDAPEVRKLIPDWYRRLVPARGLLLLPIVVDKKPLGLIYADKDRGQALELSPKELGLVKTLRNEAVLAIEKKR